MLIDVAGYKDVEFLQGGYEISAADLKGALNKQGTEIKPGDVVVIHTGWGKAFWMKDNDRYNDSEPGIGMDAGHYLVEQKIVMACSDNWGIEVVPGTDPTLTFPVHQLFLTKHGIYNLENVITEKLAADKVYEFALYLRTASTQGRDRLPRKPNRDSVVVGDTNL